MVGQSCINHEKMWTDWDHSRLKPSSGVGSGNGDELGELFNYHMHSDTVVDELGLRCADPDDEATCPKARKCVNSDLCHTDQPNWSDDEILQQNYPFGWGPNTPKYLDPNVEHSYILPPGYSAHLETTGWSVTPRDPNDMETLG